IAGALAWQEVGLAAPAAVEAATAAYRAESDSVGEWIQQRCTIGVGASIQAKRLYDDFAAFVVDRGAHRPTMRWWAQRMADRGFEKDEGRVVHYLGITLCDLFDHCDQFPETSPYPHAHTELPEKGREGREGRGDIVKNG